MTTSIYASIIDEQILGSPLLI